MHWPLRFPPTASRPSGASNALQSTLSTRGFVAADFELEEAPSTDLSLMLGVSTGILKVRCGSTGEERVYSTGSGSAWLGAFLMDLSKGHFANALRQPLGV